MEDLEEFFQNNPHYYGLVLVAIGGLFGYGVYKDWNWIFQGDGRVFNIAWISDTFGRQTARILMGALAVLLIVLGVIWFFLFQ